MIPGEENMKKKYGKICFSMFALVLLTAGCAENRSAQEAPQPQKKAAETNSETESAVGTASEGIVFEGQDVEGNAVSNTIFSEAKLTMVNVWATYCNPCLREMPGLGELAGEYGAGEFQIIGVISDVTEDADGETIAAAASLIEATGADYPHLLLNEAIYFALLKDVTAVPTTFFIDEEGKVLDTVIGAMEKSAWEEKINAFLEER